LGARRRSRASRRASTVEVIWRYSSRAWSAPPASVDGERG
jgi:hypothetical protein